MFVYFRLLELRYSPTEFRDDGGSGLTFSEIHAAVQNGIAQGIEICLESGSEIVVGVISCGVGGFGKEKMRELVDFTIENKYDSIELLRLTPINYM